MKLPIVVFTDDIDLFEDLKHVEAYFEAWILEKKFSAYDSEGRVLKPSIVNVEKKRFLGILSSSTEQLKLDSTEQLKPEELKTKLTTFVEKYRSLEETSAQSKNPGEMSLPELINSMISLKSYTK